MKKISFIMSAYNAENFIKEAIDSILSQTFTDFEFIIINDASTDSTESIIKSYGDSRIKLRNNQQNEGLAKSLNAGLDIANGKYIARMDADDVSLPERFQKQFDFMEQNPDVDLCGTFYETFGDKIFVVRTPENDTDIKDTLFFYNCIAHPSVMIRKDSFEKYGIKYDEDLRSAQDYELWCREADRLKYANIPEILLKYRIHDNQTGFAKKKEQDATAGNIRSKNLKKTGIELSDEELSIYLNILKNDYSFSSEKIYDACMILDRAGKAGVKSGYGQRFEEIIRTMLNDLAEEAIKKKMTSIKLFRVFMNWRVFKTKRAEIRFLYHSLRKILNV